MKRALAILTLLAVGTTYYTIVHAEDYNIAGEAMGQRAHLVLPTEGSMRTEAGLEELEYLGTVSVVVDGALTSAGASAAILEARVEKRLSTARLKVSDVPDLPPEALSIEVKATQDGSAYAGAVVLTVTQPAYLERTSRRSGSIYVLANKTYVGSGVFMANAADVPAAIEASIYAVVDEFTTAWQEANRR
ncbi:hypothetical protein HN371_05545 [Candidatus Poribacteria bacterium]|jgi:hypothetical protein|nr:hypothetical protein [Candidatus Poribacteria bacterium]MBT5532319.1 hypothetical protein [Candidatus Poribacteria bacterium]MBT5711198.1 hypothetical protein [Candidatus Poribacteria bacterium]MBT7805383.1 hypothetical protein [Candidatus Poribacteria bacterium]